MFLEGGEPYYFLVIYSRCRCAPLPVTCDLQRARSRAKALGVRKPSLRVTHSGSKRSEAAEACPPTSLIAVIRPATIALQTRQSILPEQISPTRPSVEFRAAPGVPLGPRSPGGLTARNRTAKEMPKGRSRDSITLSGQRQNQL